MRYPNYRKVDTRCKSFRKWTHFVEQDANQTAVKLALAGFFYPGSSDVISCFNCGIDIVISKSDPWGEHAWHSPICEFLIATRNKENIKIMREKWKGANHPKQECFMSLQKRVDSFQEWPEDLTQRPLDLAVAGFFYAGTQDKVRCFYCDIGLQGWNPGEEPCNEHIKWSPSCKYVRKTKGDDFVEEVKRQLEQTTGEKESASRANCELRPNKVFTEQADRLLRLKWYSHQEVQDAVNVCRGNNGMHCLSRMKPLVCGEKIDAIEKERNTYTTLELITKIEDARQPCTGEQEDPSMSRNQSRTIDIIENGSSVCSFHVSPGGGFNVYDEFGKELADRGFSLYNDILEDTEGRPVDVVEPGTTRVRLQLKRKDTVTLY